MIPKKSYKVAYDQKLPPGHITELVPLPEFAVRSIIGKGGSAIQAIEEDSGTRIRVSGDHIATVTGTEESVATGVALIESRVECASHLHEIKAKKNHQDKLEDKLKNKLSSAIRQANRKAASEALSSPVETIAQLEAEALASAPPGDADDDDIDEGRPKRFVLKRWDPPTKSSHAMEFRQHQLDQLEPIMDALEREAASVDCEIDHDIASGLLWLVPAEDAETPASEIDALRERLGEIIHNRIKIQKGKKIGLILATVDVPEHERRALEKRKAESKHGGVHRNGSLQRKRGL